MNVSELYTKGYVHIRNAFDHDKILQESEKTLNIAQNEKWKFIKVYHNIFINNYTNIFCINFPFNNKLNPNLYDSFININMKEMILNNTIWKGFLVTQVELQHNEKFNYQGTWHRDYKNINLENIVLILYLRDEKGFRIIPKNIEKQVIKKYPEFGEKHFINNYLNISNQYYHIIDAKAGDAVIFDSGLIHQGYAKGKRTHFFIRCSPSDVFKIDNHLKPNAEFKILEQESKKYNYNYNKNYYNFKNRLVSFLSLVVYFFPLNKIFKYLLDFKKKKIHFHYSFYQ